MTDATDDDRAVALGMGWRLRKLVQSLLIIWAHEATNPDRGRRTADAGTAQYVPDAERVPSQRRSDFGGSFAQSARKTCRLRCGGHQPGRRGWPATIG